MRIPSVSPHYIVPDPQPTPGAAGAAKPKPLESDVKIGRLDVRHDGREERNPSGEAPRQTPDWWAHLTGYVAIKALYQFSFGRLAGLAGLVAFATRIPTDSPYTAQDARRDREIRHARERWESRHGVPAEGMPHPSEEDMVRWYRQRNEPHRAGGNERPPIMGGAVGAGHHFSSWGSSSQPTRRQRERRTHAWGLGVWSGRGTPQSPDRSGGTQTPNNTPPSGGGGRGGGGGNGGGTMQPSQSSRPHDARPTDRADRSSSSSTSEQTTESTPTTEVRNPDPPKPEIKKAVGLAPDPSAGGGSGNDGDDLGARIPKSSPDNRPHMDQVLQPGVRLVSTRTGAADEEEPDIAHPPSTNGGGSSDDLGDDLGPRVRRSGGGISTPFAPRFRENDPAGPEGGPEGH